MTPAEWFAELKPFIEPHPQLHPEAGEIYVPRPTYQITFAFVGGLQAGGTAQTLEINFNSERFLILALGDRVLRLEWPHLVGFELAPRTKPSAHELKLLRSLH